MTSNLKPDNFKALYVELGLGDELSGNLAPLHTVCPHAEKCWLPSEIPALAESERTKISHPWIGSSYQELKLLCLGINMNDHGGFSACHDLVISACEEMDNGAIKVRFECDPQVYSGTLLFHRMGKYSALIAQAAGISVQLDKTGFPSHKEVVRAFDFIAYTNHIDHNSTQIISTLGGVQIKQASYDGRQIKLIVVPHPAAVGWSVKQLMTDMQKALSTVNNW